MLRMDIELLKKQMEAVAEACDVDLTSITLEDDETENESESGGE